MLEKIVSKNGNIYLVEHGKQRGVIYVGLAVSASTMPSLLNEQYAMEKLGLKFKFGDGHNNKKPLSKPLNFKDGMQTYSCIGYAYESLKISKNGQHAVLQVERIRSALEAVECSIS